MRRPRQGGGGAGGSAAARARAGGLGGGSVPARARGAPAAAPAAWLRDLCAAMARPPRQHPGVWAPLLLLLLTGPAACAASPADDGAGPGGYPFPTAPPVDPFAKIKVDDCGKTKGCFRYGKPGCNAETCDYFLSYRMIGADVEFELSADTDGWVAVGFSSDKKMGGDDVMACVHDDNGRVRIQHFYNVGQWAKEIQRNPARDEEGVFENNRVTCRFKRPVNVPRDETIVDLHLSWYYLFAWGPAIQGSITRHDIDSPPASERVVSIYKYEDIFMPSAAYQTFSSPFCLLLIVALTFYLLMGTP
uniref:Ferric chelate reductase 1 like n=1 Tax=Nomascus leucogenys TaxID=61853 RepID=G1S6K8_NOMLE